MSEAATDQTTEPIVCEHDHCVVIRIRMSAEFRKGGEVEKTEDQDIATVHSGDRLQVWLDLIRETQEFVFAEADYVMQEFHLPPELLSLVMHGDNVEVVVKPVKGDGTHE